MRVNITAIGACMSVAPAIGSQYESISGKPVRYFFLLFVAVPIIEIALLIRVGSIIGVWSTIGIVILTAALGSWLLRQQGLSTMLTAREKLNSGQMPASELLQGLILLIGGVLLLTPGFFTDAVGFLCLLPPSRKWLANRLTRSAVTFGFGPGVTLGGEAAPNANRQSGRPDPRQRNGDIIEGEYRREE